MADHLDGPGQPDHKLSREDADDALINRIARDVVNTNSNNLLGFQAAPESAAVRYATVTVQGISNVPMGIYDAGTHLIKHPLEGLETAGMSAGMALALKTILPETGLAGKIAGAAIGLYFTAKAAEPILDSYKKAGAAKNIGELDLASKEFGDAGGSFIVNSAVAAIGYKAGSHIAERTLSSASMDGFADTKENFYKKLDDMGSRFKSSFGAKPPEAVASPRQTTLNPRVTLEGSEHVAPQGILKGDVDPNANIDVTLMLKSKGSDLKMDRTLARIQQGRQAPLSDAEFANLFGSQKTSLDAITNFADQYGIKVTESDLSSGRVGLSGRASSFNSAFDTSISEYEDNGVNFRARAKALSVPKEIAEHIESVLGTDTRPQMSARSSVRFLDTTDDVTPLNLLAEQSAHKKINAEHGFLPSEVASAYNFPTQSKGKGQGVAIVELAGGLDLKDNAAYYEKRNLPLPNINVIELGKAKNKVGNNARADGEVALDSQVIGVVAPEATQNLIFAANTDKGFIDAVTRATFPEKGEVANSSISISWGAPEDKWTQHGLDGLQQAFKKAALKGISVFAASGDEGALDGTSKKTFQTDYPASDPTVTGTGGTTLALRGGKIVSEVAWNQHKSGHVGGGGISQIFPPQPFQQAFSVPNHAQLNTPGRGVPDIAGHANGFLTRVSGKEAVTVGTSGVAPLYAALTAILNGSLEKPTGTLNPWLYKHPEIFNDITLGDNDGYSAGPGWDPVTGLGSIDGTKMLNALKKDPNLETSFGNFRFVGPAQIGGNIDSSSESTR